METLQRIPPHKQAWKKSSALICQGTCKYRLTRIIQSINFHGTGGAAGSLPTRRCCKAQGKAAEFRVADISEGQQGCRLNRWACAMQTRVNTLLLNPYPTWPKEGLLVHSFYFLNLNGNHIKQPLQNWAAFSAIRIKINVHLEAQMITDTCVAHLSSFSPLSNTLLNLSALFFLTFIKSSAVRFCPLPPVYRAAWRTPAE